MKKAAQRDRWMQVFLAQARGPTRNGDLLRRAIDRALRIRAVREGKQRETIMDDALMETLQAVVEALESVGAVYTVTGSVASSIHGEPFSSLDVDLVLQASRGQVETLSETLSPRFYAPVDRLREAAERHDLANVVDNRTGLKVDLSFIGEDAFLREVLRRRVRMPIGTHPAELWFVTAEDVILLKLLCWKDTRSAKQWENALSVARVRGARLDWAYLFKQAHRLHLEDDLVNLRDEAGI